MTKLQLKMERPTNDNGCPKCNGNLEYSKLFKRWVCENKICSFKGYKSLIKNPWENIKYRD